VCTPENNRLINLGKIFDEAIPRRSKSIVAVLLGGSLQSPLPGFSDKGVSGAKIQSKIRIDFVFGKLRRLLFAGYVFLPENASNLLSFERHSAAAAFEGVKAAVCAAAKEAAQQSRSPGRNKTTPKATSSYGPLR